MVALRPSKMVPLKWYLTNTKELLKCLKLLVYENIDVDVTYSVYTYQQTGPVAADVLDATGKPI